MSSETINPISPARFAAALQELPLDALHAKVAELQNSISHLRSSNEQMLPFAEEGDQDCKDAMFENLGVIGRISERIGLIRKEVEERGMPFPTENGSLPNGSVEEGRPLVNGTSETDDNSVLPSNAEQSRAETSGTLTDEELRRRLEAQLADEEDGVHL